jgi:hypothetical protein
VTTPKLEIGFSGPGVAETFQLDSPTRGALDSARLGPFDALVDLSDRLVSLSVDRGKQDLVSPMSVGRAQVVLRNLDGVLDPQNTGSVLFPGVQPRRSLNLYADGVQVFAGFVDDIDLDYSPGGDATVTVSASDGLSLLGLASFPVDGLAVGQEDAGARIGSVLASDSQFWTGGTAISVGDSVFAAGTATENVLSYLQTVERSEGGVLFASRTGDLTFRDRNFAAQNPTALTLSDQGVGVEYQRLSRVSGDDDLFNRVQAEAESVTFVAFDSGSADNFGLRSLDLGGLLIVSGEGQDRVDWETVRRALPLPSVREVEVLQVGSAGVEVLELDLGGRVLVEFAPPGVGLLSQDSTVIGVRHQWTVGVPWRSAFRLRSIEADPLFVLDDATLGQLGVGRLAY